MVSHMDENMGMYVWAAVPLETRNDSLCAVWRALGVYSGGRGVSDATAHKGGGGMPR